MAEPALSGDRSSLVPLDRAVIYDFEHLPLGPVGEGGPSQGEPEDLSWAAVGQVEVIAGSIDGKNLEITKPSSGAPTAWFELPGNPTLKTGQVRFQLQLRPSEHDDYQVMFRTAGSAAETYGNIRLFASGNLSASDGAGSTGLGSYSADELLEFTVDFDLDQSTWSVWFNGELAVEDRAISVDLSHPDTAGLGRIGVGMGSAATPGRTLEVDNIEILINDPGVTLLHADFNDKTVGEYIGAGGAALGEPVAISSLLEAWVGNGSGGDPALFVMKEDGATFDNAYTEWDFLGGASVQTGWLDARFDLAILEASNNHFIVTGAGEELLRIETTANGREVLVRFPDQANGVQVGSYEIAGPLRLRIVCQMDERFCSVALNGEWVISERPFADDTSPDLAVDRFFAGIAGVTASDSFIELDNLRISATAPSALPVSAEFIQQPTDTVCQMAFDPAPSVRVTDGLGEPVPGEWTLILSEYTSVLGWNPFDIDADPVTVDGLAELVNVRIRRTGEGARMQAVVAGYSPPVVAISEPFDALPGPLDNVYYEGSGDDGPFLAGRPQTLWVGIWDDCNNAAPIGTEGMVVIHTGPEGASLSGNAGVVDEWGEIELDQFVFDRPGEYVLDLEIDGIRLETLSSPIVVESERIFGDRFQALPE